MWAEVISKVSSRRGKKFWLLDGPPYPNAEPHMGHVRGITAKDLFIKMRAMQGFRVWIKPGFDTHGLPIENKVEKELGIESKEDIERMGISLFMKKCKEFATSNIDMWMDFYKKLGVWFGWTEPYLTLQKEYMDSVWWSISELWKKGLLVAGEKPFYWCSHCQTVLSGYEVTDEYRELDDLSVFVKFPTEKGFHIAVWTTTPWTLPGNVALVVRGDADYARVRVGDGEVVIAKALLSRLDELEVSYEVVETFKGKELEGLKYYPVVECSAQRALDGSGKARRIYLSRPVIKQKVGGKVAAKKETEEETQVGEFVNLEEGTGVVHCAPGHGPEDFELGKLYGLEAISPVDGAGRFTGDVEPFKGEFVRDANPKIVEYLRERGLLLGEQRIRHRYPVCWRCKSPLVFRLTKQWFLEVEPLKEQLIREAEKVEWLPPFAKERMVSWLEGAKDWTLSRQRYWNIPLPIWTCGEHVRVVSGSEELSRLSGKPVEDLHRDVVDGLTFRCEECGKTMRRVSDVLDVWYDSGAASFAVPGYPYNRENFEMWPTDWIEEGQDQIRGWFYTLLVPGVALFGKAPYRRVSMHGWVVDEKGEKMSKSKGNFVTGREALEQLGPDVLRFYILWESAPWDLIRFSPERARKEVGRMFHVWANLHSYLLGFYREGGGRLRLEDRWILSKYNSLVKKVTEGIESYNLHHAMRAIYSFIVEDWSRKYMKLVKGRVREGDTAPLEVMKQLHHGMLRLVAPIAPFFTEEKYGEFSARFGGEDSVFLESYPEPDGSKIDADLEKKVDRAFEVVEAVLAYRDEKGIGLRYPLRRISVPFDLGELESLVRELANVRSIESGFRGEEVALQDGRLVIDPELGEEELREGYVREVSRRVRAMRKEAGRKPSETLPVHIWGDDRLVSAVKELEEEFVKRVGASEVHYSEGGSLKKEWKIKGMSLFIGL